MSNEQLTLPSIAGYESRHFKTTISGSITDPESQPARALALYDDVLGVFVGTVAHAGADATYIGKDKTPVYTTKVACAQVLVPLSKATQADLLDVVRRIHEENRQAGTRLGLVTADETAGKAG